MRKRINGVSIILIFIISIYILLRTVFDAHQVKSTATTAVAAAATPSPNSLLVSTTPTPDPPSTPTPALVSTPTLKPLKGRVVKHQPDQFCKGALGKEELSVIKKAIKTIPWSRNSDPKAAANEDYAAIAEECEKSGVHDLLTDLITEAVSNDYQPNNEAANGAYFTQLNSDFENRDQSGYSNQRNTGEIATRQGTSLDSGLTPGISQPNGPANATSWSPTERSASAVIRSNIGHVRHRSAVRHRIIDVKMRLIALWHQSLARTEKSPNWLYSDSHEGQTKK
jgi:hypothetical protein